MALSRDEAITKAETALNNANTKNAVAGTATSAQAEAYASIGVGYLTLAQLLPATTPDA